MSKIYDMYKKLKKENSSKLYLFKNGNFYIFIDDDADLINNYVVLKKSKFCKECDKCGFPVSKLNDYLKVFENHKLNIEVINNINLDNKDIIKKLEKIDINKITPFKALSILKELKELV